MAAIKIQVEGRTGTGKNKVDKIRQEDFIPGVLYGKGQETKHIQVERRVFEKVYKTAGMSTLIDLELDGDVSPVLIKEVQTHPFKNQFLHVDFQKLNMNEKVKLTIPITLLGRDDIVVQPSILIQQLDEIEIECLPGDIPQSIEIDVRNIDFTTPIFVSDLDMFNGTYYGRRIRRNGSNRRWSRNGSRRCASNRRRKNRRIIYYGKQVAYTCFFICHFFFSGLK